MEAAYWAGCFVTLSLAVLGYRLEAQGRELRRALHRYHQEQLIAVLLTRFGPVIASAEPQNVCRWQEVVETARRLYPEAFAQIEVETGDRFPFSANLLENAHARWTADWLAWERQHDVDFKLRASTLMADLERLGTASSSTTGAKLAASERHEAQTRLDAIEEERLRTYQQRYEEYVRVGNQLRALGE